MRTGREAISRWHGLCGLVGLAFAGCLSVSGATQAQPKSQDESNRTAVLELYTSQGCKSCPQADRNMSAYADDPNVLALSFHVNYWDYMGWRDTLATQEATDRQDAYRNAFNAKMVYTPQAIVNGEVEMNGGDAAEIGAHLAASSLKIPISIQPSGNDRLSIEIAAGEKPQTPAHVVLLYLHDSVTIPIDKGENAGQSLTYRNTVSDINTIGVWDGEALKIELPASELDRKDVTGCAIILQEYRNGKSLGPILGAALFKDKRELGL